MEISTNIYVTPEVFTFNSIPFYSTASATGNPTYFGYCLDEAGANIYTNLFGVNEWETGQFSGDTGITTTRKENRVFNNNYHSNVKCFFPKEGDAQTIPSFYYFRKKTWNPNIGISFNRNSSTIDAWAPSCFLDVNDFYNETKRIRNMQWSGSDASSIPTKTWNNGTSGILHPSKDTYIICGGLSDSNNVCDLNLIFTYGINKITQEKKEFIILKQSQYIHAIVNATDGFCTSSLIYLPTSPYTQSTMVAIPFVVTDFENYDFPDLYNIIYSPSIIHNAVYKIGEEKYIHTLQKQSSDGINAILAADVTPLLSGND